MNFQVKDTIARMRYEVRNGFSEKNIEKHFADFKISHPKLYAMILENGDYDSILDSLLDAAEVVKSGEITQEDMDKTIGFRLAQKYVYPNLDMHKETQEYISNQMKESDDLEEKIAKNFKKWEEEDKQDNGSSS